MEQKPPQSGSSVVTCNPVPNTQKNQKNSDNHVRKLMLDTWSKTIFSEIKSRLQKSAMKIIQAERVGEPFDSQLVIGVRESYGILIFRISILKDILLFESLIK